MLLKKSILFIIAAFGAYSVQAQLSSAELEQRTQEKLRGIVPSHGHSRGGAPEQDCNSAIGVCQSTYVQPISYSGEGTIQEVPNSSCLGSQELNSVWYIFTVQTPGTLTFIIDPNNNSDDYDFALYNLTGRNCSDIPNGAAPEVRCNFCVTPGNTGLSNAGTNPSEPASNCNEFSTILNVAAGQTYVLTVSNYSSSQSGYTLTFGGTANIFDNVAPSALLATTPCGANFLTLQMSEAVLCSSISPSGSEFTLTGPGGPYTISSAAGINCGNATSQITIGLSPPLTQGSNYILTVNNGNDTNTLIDNCGNAMAPGTIFNFTAAPPPSDIAGPATVCSGSSMTLTASLGITYQWSPGGQTTRTITVNPTVNTTYSVTVTSGTCTGTAAHSVTVNDSPTAGFTYSPNPVCAGQQIQFTNTSIALGMCLFSGGSCTTDSDCGGFDFCFPGLPSYYWDFGDGAFDFLSTNPSHTYNTAGTYNVSLTISDLIGGCSNQLIVPITVLSTGGTLTVSNDTAICEGESVTLTASGGASYAWTSNPFGFTATTAAITVSPTTTTTYRVTSPGCSTSSTDSVTITVTTVSVIINPSTAEICEDDVVTLTATGGNLSGFSWTPAVGLNTTTGSTVDANPTATTTYNVIATTLTGCAAAGSATVTVNQNPAPTITPTGPVTLCPGDNIILDAGAGYTTYVWSTGDATQTVVIDTAGIFTVTVIDTNNCTGDAAVITNVSSTLNPVITGPHSICPGANATLDAGAGYATYTWSSGEFTRTISVTQSDTFTVSVTSGSCSGVSAPFDVTVSSSLTPVITIISSANFCDGDSAILVADAGYLTYNWSTGDTTESIVVDQSGVYDVSVSDNFGCSGTSAQETITVNPNPTPTITPLGPLTFCLGGSVDLDAGGPYQAYSWSTGDTTQFINVVSVGNYLVTITDNNNCVGESSPVSVNISSSLFPTITSSGQVCEGYSVTLTADAGYFSYSWNTGDSLNTITVMQDGLYSVSVSDGGGCNGTDQVNVTFFELPVITYNDTCQFGKGAISVTVTDGTPPFAYSWSDGSALETLTALDAGIYGVTVTDVNTCFTTASVIIDCPIDNSFISVPTAFSPNGDGKNDFIAVMGDKTKIGRYEFGIFNRWGQKVFFTDNLSLISESPGSSKGWDGYYQGKPQDIGVFTYYVNVEFLNGTKDNIGGSITLVR